MKQRDDAKELIINTLKQHPEGLMLIEIARLTAMNRVTITKYIHELKGAGIIFQKEAAAARLCYLKSLVKGNSTKKNLKGISTLTSIILLLMILVALIGAAYFFMSSLIEIKNAQTFEIIDVTDEKVLVRNIGTESINSFKTIVDEKEVENKIVDGSIPPNSLGSVILLGITQGYHDLLLVSKSMSQWWKWYYLKHPVIFFEDFSKGAEGWSSSSNNWKVTDGQYVQENGIGIEYTNNDVGIKYGMYEMNFMLSGKKEVSFTVASNGSYQSGVSTVFNEENSTIEVRDQDKLYKSAYYDFNENVWYSVRVELDQNQNYKLYINGEHISSLDFTVPEESIKGTILQLGTDPIMVSFDNIKVSGIITEKKEITFDRILDCPRCGQHKTPPLTNVKMTITAKVSAPIENVNLIDYYPNEWIIINTNGGIISKYNSTYNKIEWEVRTAQSEISRWYIIQSPQLTIPPTSYNFFSELANQKSDLWFVIVADPILKIKANATSNGIISTKGQINEITTGAPLTLTVPSLTQGTELNPNEYIAIGEDDNNEVTQAGSTTLDAYIKTNYTLPENAEIKWIYIQANMRGSTTSDPLSIYVMNWTDSKWYKVNSTGTTGSTTEIILYFNISETEILHFVSRNMTRNITSVLLIATGNTARTDLYVDYSAITISYLPKIKYSYLGVNNSAPKPNEYVLHYANWSSNADLSHYIFWNNYTDPPMGKNYTIPFGANTWSNITNRTPSTAGYYAWRIYANNSDGVWEDTGIQIIEVANRWLEVNWAVGSQINSTTCTASLPCQFSQNSIFNANATVKCKTDLLGLNCDSVTGGIRYNDSNNAMVFINTTEGAIPFYIVGSAPTPPQNWTEVDVSTFPVDHVLPNISRFAMTYDNKRKLVFIRGGMPTGSTFIRDTWVFNYTDKRWYNITSGTEPPPRGKEKMVYLPTVDRIILFGGYDGSRRLKETWEYNISENKWYNITGIDSTPPPERDYFGMTYDSDADRIIIFGGTTGITKYNDTWVFNYTDKQWYNVTQNDPKYIPPDMEELEISYDSDAKRTILQGGLITPAAVYSTDTWEFNISDYKWYNITNVVGNTYLKRINYAMTYDNRNKLTILYGGQTSTQKVNDTWVFNYTDKRWYNITNNIIPNTSYWMSMVYMSHVNKVLMYGGNDIFLKSTNRTYEFSLGGLGQAQNPISVGTLDTDKSYQLNFTINVTGYSGAYRIDLNFSSSKIQGNSTNVSYVRIGIGPSCPNYCDYCIGSLTDTYLVSESNKYYCVGNNIYIAGKSAINFTSGVQNSTLDCLNYRLNSNNVFNTTGVYLYGVNTKNNTIKNCIITNFYYGIYLSNGLNNILIDNIIYNNTYGVVLVSTSKNLIKNGSISNNNMDYYLESAGTTNNFTNTNFTDVRKISFIDTISWFNYKNDTVNDIWLKTNVSAKVNITRKLINLDQTLIQWNESISSVVITRYNITGLNPNKYYLVYNDSSLYRINKTNSLGELSFTMNLPDTNQHTITVQQDLKPPYYCCNSVNNTVANRTTEFSLLWTDYVGLDSYRFYLDNCTGTFVKMSERKFPNGGYNDWSKETYMINGTLGCTVRWRFEANDTNNNWNQSLNYSFTVKFAFIIVNLTKPEPTVCNQEYPCEKEQNKTFNVSASVKCELLPPGYTSCGEIYGYLRYNSTSNEPDTNISIVKGDKPFYVIGTSTGVTYYRPVIYTNSTFGAGITYSPQYGYDDGYGDINTYARVSIRRYQGYGEAEIVYIYDLPDDSKNNVVLNITVSNPENGFGAAIYTWDWVGNKYDSFYTSPSDGIIHSYSQTLDSKYINDTGSVKIRLYIAGTNDGIIYNGDLYDNFITIPSGYYAENPKSCGHVFYEKICNLTWEVNTTGNPGEIRAIDVNFTSIIYDIKNDTNNAYLKIIERKPPQWFYNKTSPLHPAMYQPNQKYQFNITWIDNTAMDNVIFEWNGKNISSFKWGNISKSGNEYYFNLTDLPAGSYSYRWYANDTFNNWNSTSLMNYVINPAPTKITLYLNGTEWLLPAERAYPNATKVNATINVSSLQPNVILQRNSSSVSNPEEVLLGAGSYEYVGSYIGNQNYSSSYTSRTLTITPGFSNVTLFLNGTRGNLKMNVTGFLNTTAVLVKPATGKVEIWSNYSGWSIWANGSSPLQNVTQINKLGIINFTANFTHANYTSSYDSYFVNVTEWRYLIIESIKIMPEGDIYPIDGGNVKMNVTVNVSLNTTPIQACDVRILNSSDTYSNPSKAYVGTIQKKDSKIQCFQSWDMEYWRNPGQWNVTVYMNLTAGLSNFTSQNFTYKGLASVIINVSTINFTGYPGQIVNSYNAYPLSINNTGNMKLDISLNGSDFIGVLNPSYVIGVGNATYNESTSGNFIPLKYNPELVFKSIFPAQVKLLYFKAYLPLGFIGQNYTNSIRINHTESQ